MKYGFLCFVVLFLASCQSGDQPKETEKNPLAVEYTEEMESDLSLCPNSIAAIFTQGDSSTIKTHSFELFTAHAIEKATFENGLKLELHQSGCKFLKQRYQFFLPTEIDESGADAAFWADIAAKQFEYLATFLPEFSTYQQIVLVGRDHLKLGEPIQITKDAAYQIEKFVQNGQTIVVVEMELA